MNKVYCRTPVDTDEDMIDHKQATEDLLQSIGLGTPCLIIGGPLMGKTTLLNAMHRYFSKPLSQDDHLRDTNGIYIPVMVRLRDAEIKTMQDIWELILRKIREDLQTWLSSCVGDISANHRAEVRKRIDLVSEVYDKLEVMDIRSFQFFLNSYISVLTDVLSNGKLLILFDDIEGIQDQLIRLKFVEFWIDFYSPESEVAIDSLRRRLEIVISCRLDVEDTLLIKDDHRRFRMRFGRVWLTPFSFEDIQICSDFFQRKGCPDHSLNEVLTEIYRSSGGYPGLVQEILSQVDRLDNGFNHNVLNIEENETANILFDYLEDILEDKQNIEIRQLLTLLAEFGPLTRIELKRRYDSRFGRNSLNLERRLQQLAANGALIFQRRRSDMEKLEIANPLLRELIVQSNFEDIAVGDVGVELDVRMRNVPITIYHMLKEDSEPLASVRLVNRGTNLRRLSIVFSISQYSQRTARTVSIPAASEVTIHFLPPLDRDVVASINESTATVAAIEVKNTDTQQFVEHSKPINLLSRNSFLLAYRCSEQKWVYLTHYLAAYVTPNADAIRAFLQLAAKHHPEGRLRGTRDDTYGQVEAIYSALRAEGITYIDSSRSHVSIFDWSLQRIRLPKETLGEKSANCIDLVLLFASLIEAISLNPIIAIFSNHALIGWDTGKTETDYEFLETTMLHDNCFTDAVEIGKRRVDFWKKSKSTALQLHDISELRRQGILPVPWA